MMDVVQPVAAVLTLISIFAVVHAYVLYPLILLVLQRFVGPAPIPRLADDPEQWPTISLVVSVYNEAAAIERKVRNFQQLDYPAERLELLVGDDCSDDDTREVLEALADEDPRIRLHAFDQRSGKATVLNALVPKSQADLLFMCDAASLHSPDSAARFAAWLTDPRIGVVGSRMTYLKPPGGSPTGEKGYWRLENFLRQAESDLGCGLQPAGPGYALRREDFCPLPPNTICDDFHLPLTVIENGGRVLIDRVAEVCKPQAVSSVGEFHRRVRIGTGDAQILFHFTSLLDPRRGRLWFAYLSHKVLRWLGPWFMLAAWLGSLLAAAHPLFAALFVLQSVGYAATGLAHLFPALRKKSKLVNLAYHFFLINLALMVGFVRYFTDPPKGTWETGWREKKAE